MLNGLGTDRVKILKKKFIIALEVYFLLNEWAVPNWTMQIYGYILLNK